MKLTIKSRRLGRKVTFWANETYTYSSYVHLDLNGQEGCLGNQICDGGRLMGSTITCTTKSFEHICRRWWTQWLRGTSEDWATEYVRKVLKYSDGV
jgi:hypothetical protein